jgi:hypothetical protein
MKTEQLVDNHQQTRACQQLLASVVASAVNDTCVEPFRATSKDKSVLMRIDTVTAFRFLFDTSVSGVDAYGLWLDFNVDQFRRKLLEMMFDESPFVVGGKDPQARRNFRYNYKLWQKVSTLGISIESTSKDEEEDDDRLGRRTIEIEFTR